MSSNAYIPVSTAAIDHVKLFESLRLRTYDDLTGKPIEPGSSYQGTPTIGFGNVSFALPARAITIDEAERLLSYDINDTLKTMSSLVPYDILKALPQPAYDALFGFTFNVGRQAFVRRDKSRTDFFKALESTRRDVLVPDQMMRWVYSGGRRMNGLVRRRATEAAMWSSGYATVGALPAGVVPDAEFTAGTLSQLAAAVMPAVNFGKRWFT